MLKQSGMLIDSHAHIYDEQYGEDGAQKIISGMEQDGLEYIVCVGCDMPSSFTCAELAKNNARIYATVGVHPYDADTVTDENIQKLHELAVVCDKVVAVGEIGLDFHRSGSDKPLQISAMQKQYDLARELKKPMVFHQRDSYGEFVEFAKTRDFPDGAVLHCFSSSKEIAEHFIKKNFYISFSGTVTYNNAVNLVRAAECVPLDRLLIETDSPYLTPAPKRYGLNYPKNVALVAQRLAEIKGVSYDEMVRITNENAKRIFGINQ
ncbi:MAG: TatD family hydrolase [Clostridiales bacterium]|nr:TatD family hydrolase [Clostridiales bacterium]